MHFSRFCLTFIFQVVYKTFYINRDTFFYLLFGCPTANFRPLLRGQPHSTNLNQCIIQVSTQGSLEAYNKVGSRSLAEHLLRHELGTFGFYNNTLTYWATLPIGHSSNRPPGTTPEVKKVCID